MSVCLCRDVAWFLYAPGHLSIRPRAASTPPAPPSPGDLNETFVVGEVDADSKQLVKVTYDVSPDDVYLF